MTEKNQIRDAADAVRGIAEAIPVYQDLAQPAVQEVGKSLQGIVRIALSPVAAMVWGYEQIGEYLAERVTEKLRGIPKERIISPPLSVAGPAVEAMRFTKDAPALSEMFANLLATAMDSATVATAHPAFVEVIRQLTPDEARLLALFVKQRSRPVVHLHRHEAGSAGYSVVMRNFGGLAEMANCALPNMESAYLENLCRLGVLEIPEGVHLIDENLYTEVEARFPLTGMKASIDRQEDRWASIHRAVVQLTDFGFFFVTACIAQAHGTERSDGGETE